MDAAGNGTAFEIARSFGESARSGGERCQCHPNLRFVEHLQDFFLIYSCCARPLWSHASLLRPNRLKQKQQPEEFWSDDPHKNFISGFRHLSTLLKAWMLRGGSGRREVLWPANVVYLDPDHDLCQLNVTRLVTQPVPIRRSASLSVGERVFAIGAPEGLELKLSEGLISGLREYQNAHLIQTSAAISPGSSGGGLFDSQGRLVGITTYFLKEGQNLNFALPGEWVESLSRQAVSSSQKASVDTSAFQAMILMELGFKAFGDTDFEKASDAYHEALRVQPGLADAWYWLGAIDEGKPFKRLSEGRDPNWPEAHRQAIEHYKKALELRPEFAGAWCALGNSYFATGRKADANYAEQEAIRLDPQFGLAWLYLGMIYEDSGVNEKALQAYKQATVVAPDNATVWFGLSQFYKDQQEYGQMAACLEKVLELDSTLDGAWFQLGFAYAAQGDRKMVVDVYERMKAARPESADEYFRKYLLS
jgi:tetratricopeptide (TPR) repeat protein